MFVVFAAILFQACGDSSIGTDTESHILSSTEIFPGFAQKTDGPSPQQVYDDFAAMVETVQQMSRKEIDSLSNEEVLELGKPILNATEGTVKLSKKLLNKLEPSFDVFTQAFKTMSKKEHQALSGTVEEILVKNPDQIEIRSLSSEDIITILLDYNEGDSKVMQMSSAFSTTFNVQNGYVLLYPGDNLHLANSLCPASSTFYVHSGTYSSSYVQYSKSGNTWVGVGTNPVIMNGNNSIDRAFYKGLNNNSISWIEIKNYTHHGIYSDNGSADGLAVRNMTFKNIAPNYISGPAGTHGQEHGAIMILGAEDIEVRDNYFENVASSIRFRNCDGPLKVLENEALNSGRNFFQCDNCNGSNIKINDNSMEQTAAYGDAVLEDWINIHNSKGISSSWIQVKHNRARGYAVHDHGSFIILGDAGGEYQEALENIGVNPGQVGIGVYGGEYVRVKENKMFSKKWKYSNAAYYSLREYTPCSNHTFPTSPAKNKGNWICGSDASCTENNNNYAYAPEPPKPNCGIDFYQIRSNVQKDLSLDEDIWYDW